MESCIIIRARKLLVSKISTEILYFPFYVTTDLDAAWIICALLKLLAK